MTKTYGHGSRSTMALKGVNLGVRPGCFLAVMGGSGAGKSTLLGCLAGEVLPSSGAVRRSPGGTGAATLATDEKPLPGERVGEYVERASGAGAGLGAEKLRGLYEATGLWEHRRDAAESLAAAYAPQLAVARSLARDPQLLLVDEPVAHETAGGPGEWAEVLRHAVTGTGVAVVMVTSDPAAAARADAALFLRDGLIVDALAGADPDRIADCLKMASSI
ncbi:ATP-binding cassette domain-containing protein [Streptomyces sp. NPDC021093]|uniref:ATP-binding cassette domain-containing protein n=1 Tax=Streptomyces sp. NPDC021093 TaxID=3365112 RepID=UPI0037A50095